MSSKREAALLLQHIESELIYQHEYKTDEEINTAINEYPYTWFNYIRPHSIN